MNIILFGAAGFLGTNIALDIVKNSKDNVTLVDADKSYFTHLKDSIMDNVSIVEQNFGMDTDFDKLLQGQDIVYHLVSTTVPTTSNLHIPQELMSNVVVTSKFLEACVKCQVKKIVFISSGGTVYGKELVCPVKEEMETNPISSYGLQKVTIEKLLYLYKYLYGLDYRVIRLANPYGPYQRPNGILGAVTTFTYKALKGEKITVFGDGSVVRDYIYIDDVVKGINKIVNSNTEHSLYNLGSGKGVSVNELLNTIREALNIELELQYVEGRKADVPVNYLDISRYESDFGKMNFVELREGIRKTADFLKRYYKDELN